MHRKSYAENAGLAGRRFRLRQAGPGAELGLGTHLWDGVFLLDTGEKVDEERCITILAPQTPVKPFGIRLLKDARVFHDAGTTLVQARTWLHAGEEVIVEEVAKKPWNHGSYVAGRVSHRRGIFWILLFETEFEPLQKRALAS